MAIPLSPSGHLTQATASDIATLRQPASEPIPAGLPVTVGVDQAALLLGIGRTVAYRLVLAGELRSVKIGGRRLVIRTSIEEYVSRLESDG
jgi:excisionase family DNA binding protein